MEKWEKNYIKTARIALSNRLSLSPKELAKLDDWEAGLLPEVWNDNWEENNYQAIIKCPSKPSNEFIKQFIPLFCDALQYGKANVHLFYPILYKQDEIKYKCALHKNCFYIVNRFWDDFA